MRAVLFLLTYKFGGLNIMAIKEKLWDYSGFLGGLDSSFSYLLVCG